MFILNPEDLFSDYDDLINCCEKSFNNNPSTWSIKCRDQWY